MNVAKRPCLGNSSSVISKPAESLKSPSPGSNATRRRSGLSKSTGKSPSTFQKAKLDPRMTASCSFFSPSRYSPANKIDQISPVLTDLSKPSGLRLPSPKLGFFDRVSLSF